MHQALANIITELETLNVEIDSIIPNEEPFAIVQGNWKFPNLTKSELKEDVQSIIDLIRDHETDDLGEAENRLVDYQRRIQFFRSNTLPNLYSSAVPAVSSLESTMNGLRKALSPIVDSEDKRAETRQRTLLKKLRGLEAQVKGLEPRTGFLENMVSRIEKAAETADQLPLKLDSLREANEEVKKLSESVKDAENKILGTRDEAKAIGLEMDEYEKEAKEILLRCQTAYAASTSVGLAAAFDDRSKALSKSVGLWTFGLIGALLTGSYFGTIQLYKTCGDKSRIAIARSYVDCRYG